MKFYVLFLHTTIIHWVAGLIVSSIKRLLVQCFDRLKIKQRVVGWDVRHSKLFILMFVKLYKKKQKNVRIFAKNFARNCEERMILGTSETGEHITHLHTSDICHF